MGKGIVISPDMNVSVQEFEYQPYDQPYEKVSAAVGGLVQYVRAKGLPRPYTMAVNEEGRLRNLPYNPLGSFWYGTQNHGHPIMGTIVLLREELNDEGELDTFPLTDADVEKLMLMIDEAKASKLPEEPKNPPPALQMYELPPGADFGAFLTALGFGGEEEGEEEPY